MVACYLIEYEVILKFQCLTDDMSVFEKLINNISLRKNFNGIQHRQIYTLQCCGRKKEGKQKNITGS